MTMYKVVVGGELVKVNTRYASEVEDLEHIGYVENEEEAFFNRLSELEDELMDLKEKSEIRIHEVRKIQDTLKSRLDS